MGESMPSLRIVGGRVGEGVALGMRQAGGAALSGAAVLHLENQVLAPIRCVGVVEQWQAVL
eukprot:COSAG02_NODE_45871_length_353_cov_1.023622_1_plen_60_part_10